MFRHTIPIGRISGISIDLDYSWFVMCFSAGGNGSPEALCIRVRRKDASGAPYCSRYCPPSNKVHTHSVGEGGVRIPG